MKSMKAIMKAVSPLIGTVIVISIVVASIGAILLVANPEINRAKAGMSINEAKQNMKIIDDTIRQVASEGTSAQRSLTLKTSDGTFIVRNNSGIEYILDSDFNYVPVRAVIKDESMRMTSGMSALGLAGYWRFDEGGGTFANDSSGYKNDGTLSSFSNNNINWTQGKYGNALNFDGVDDIVSAGSATILDDINILTVIAWINANNFTTGVYPSIVTKYDASAIGWNFYLDGDDRTVGLFRHFSTANGDWYANGSTFMNAGNWYHVAVVYDKSSASTKPTFYINGIAQTAIVSSTPSGSARSDATGNLTIGNSTSGYPAFNGTIDEVKIYRRALNDTEIQDDYNLPPNKLKISLDYDNIIIKGTSRWGKGTTKICIEKLGTQSNKALVEVRTC